MYGQPKSVSRISCFSRQPQSLKRYGLLWCGAWVWTALLFFSAPELFAGGAVIQGTATNAETGGPLAKVEVIVVNRGVKTLTGAAGNYRFSGLPPGRYKLLVSAPFYAKALEEVQLTEEAVYTVDFKLGEKVIEMSEIVLTATLTEKDIQSVPVATEVITAREIEELGAEKMHEALAESQGLYVQFGNGRATSASLRGLNLNQSLILVDGRRLAFGFGDNLDLDDIPVGLIDRVEVVRGPGSALYGSDAMGGVINFITRRPTEGLSGGFDVRYGQSRYGEAETPLFRGDLSGKTGRLGYSFFSRFSSKDYYDRDKSTFFGDGDQYDEASASGELSLDLGAGHRLSGGMDYLNDKQKGYREMSFGDGIRDAAWNRNSLFLEYNGLISGGMSLMLRGYRSFYENDTKNFSVGTGEVNTPLTLTGEPYHLEQDLRQVEGRVSGMFPGRQLVTAGAEHRWEDRQDNEVDEGVSNSAAFIQDEIWLANPLLVVMGARFDYHSEFGSEFSPRLGATYSPLEHLRIKSAYGEGFRAPTIYELYVHKDTQKNLLIPNSNLTAETSRGYEFTLEGERGLISARATYFRNEIDDMINTVQIGLDTLIQSGGGGGGSGGGGKQGGSSVQTRPIFKYENVDQATVQGVELSAELSLPAGFSIGEEAFLLDTRDENSGRELFNKPDFINTVKFGWSSSKLGLNANFRIISTGSQYLSLDEKADRYTVCNLHLTKKMGKNFKLHAGVYNLFNADPYLPQFQGSGTYFHLGIAADYR